MLTKALGLTLLRRDSGKPMVALSSPRPRSPESMTMAAPRQQGPRIASELHPLRRQFGTPTERRVE